MVLFRMAAWYKFIQYEIFFSLHAIKDEMFLRQTLQRQFLAFRYTFAGETVSRDTATGLLF